MHTDEPLALPQRLSEEEIDGLKYSIRNVDPNSAIGRLMYEVLCLRGEYRGVEI